MTEETAPGTTKSTGSPLPPIADRRTWQAKIDALRVKAGRNDDLGATSSGHGVHSGQHRH